MMIDKNIFKLDGKSQEQVKKAFQEFLKIDHIKSLEAIPASAQTRLSARWRKRPAG